MTYNLKQLKKKKKFKSLLQNIIHIFYINVFLYLFLFRSYRIGDFPDVKIAHSNLIEPLQQLIKLDQLVCKELIISLFCLLIEEIIENEQSNTFRENVVEILKKILKINKRDNPFNAIILEILLTLNVTDCASQDIMEVSKINDLSILGILLLEQSLIPGIQCSFSHTSNKRIRYQDNIDKDIDKWTQLASLYKSLNDVDVVLNIFRGQSFSKDLQVILENLIFTLFLQR